MIRSILLAALLCGLPLSAQEKKAEGEYEARILPLVKKYCSSCHNPEKKKGELDLSIYATQQQAMTSLDTWQQIVERVNAFEMPPQKSPQPSFEEKGLLNKWFGRLPKGKLDCNQLANDRTQRFYKGYVMSRRLNRAEYGRSVRDLFGIDLDADRDIPADGSGGEGFDNNGDALFTSPILIEKYLDAAERVLQGLLPDRGLPKSSAVAVTSKSRDGVRTLLGTLLPRAFRRPVDPPEIDRFTVLFDRAQKRGDAFEASLRLALKGMLVSPHFLYLVEPEPPKEGVYQLGSWQLAQRLSFFLWSSIPDEELHRLAAGNRLQEPAVLKEQVRRMLRDPKSRGLGETFAIQWLELEPLGKTVRPDAKKFPDFDDDLAEAMKGEAAHVFHDLFSNDASLLGLIDADFTYLNARLAKHYGFPGVEGPAFRRFPVLDRNRGGVVGMAGVLTVSSYPLRTSPVIRGKWILESLLGSKVPPPPPDAGSLPEPAEGAAPVSLRQRLEKHRTKPECSACHAKMDPLGFGLENFDPVGRWRTTVDGLAVDSVGQLPTGEKFETPLQLKQVLLARKDEVLTQLTRKLLGFALGRALTQFDKCVVDDALKALKANGHRASALVETIVLSYPFQHRYSKK